MPSAFPAEFRADVIAVARKGEAPLRQIVKDFGISEACLHRWLKIADREDGVDRTGSPVACDESAELRKVPLTQRDWDDARLISVALAIHADDPALGYRFIADQLRARGIVAGENKVARLCSQESIWSIFAKKRGLNRMAGPPVHDDLVDRRFSADRRDEVWLTDITEHRADEGKLYLCASRTCTPTGSSVTRSALG